MPHTEVVFQAIQSLEETLETVYLVVYPGHLSLILRSREFENREQIAAAAQPLESTMINYILLVSRQGSSYLIACEMQSESSSR